jgi:HAMP domain-containing protein
VGTEGKLGGQATGEGVAGTWKDLTDNVNSMAGNLTGQVRNIAEVTTAVANGDLSQEDHRRREGRDPRAEEHHQHDGRPAQLVRLRGDARGARGGHRGQARRPGRGEGVAGTWKDLTDNVNSMAGNLTGQVRNIAEVTTAVAAATCRRRSPSTSRARSSS